MIHPSGLLPLVRKTLIATFMGFVIHCYNDSRFLGQILNLAGLACLTLCCPPVTARPPESIARLLSTACPLLSELACLSCVAFVCLLAFPSPNSSAHFCFPLLLSELARLSCVTSCVFLLPRVYHSSAYNYVPMLYSRAHYCFPLLPSELACPSCVTHVPACPPSPILVCLLLLPTVAV